MASGGASVTCRYHPDAPLVEDYRAGDTICSACGMVVGDRVIDVGSEWRTFSNDKNAADMSRVGDAEDPLMSGASLSTMIQVDTSAAASFDEAGNPKYRNRRTLNSAERTSLHTFKEIEQMADRLHLPKGIPDRAKTMFKQVYDTRAFKGRNTDAIAAACLFIACRQEHVSRTYNEIAAVCRTAKKKEIGRMFKLICKHMKIDDVSYSTEHYMARFCSQLELPSHVKKAATAIAVRVHSLDEIAGKSPVSIAAAAIYMASQASDCKKTQKEVGTVAGVADATIKQAYKVMLPHAAKLFPKDFVFTVPIEHLPPS